MLFAPPSPPVMVVRRRSLVIGRAPESDLVISSRRASRNHAEVTFDGEQVVIRDLGSTNGTLVNGEPIEGPRTLQLGDRIEVGGILIHYCLVDEVAESTINIEDTAAIDWEEVRRHLAEALKGDLRQIPLSSILQMLETERKSGGLSIVTDRGTCMVWLEEGRVVHAETPELVGATAAHKICQLQEGRFLFEGGHPLTRRTIDLTVTEILIEASRQRDEAVSPEFPGFEEMPAEDDGAHGEKTTHLDPFRDWWKDD
jgi:pSer/pThr/pTyr-binding forkhead associated (FHA) protein